MKCPNPKCVNGWIPSPSDMEYVAGDHVVRYPAQKCLLCNGTGRYPNAAIIKGKDKESKIPAFAGMTETTAEITEKTEIKDDKEITMGNQIKCPLCGGKDKKCPVCDGNNQLGPRQRFLMPDGSIKETHELLKHDNNIWIGVVKYVEPAGVIPGDPAVKTRKPYTKKISGDKGDEGDKPSGSFQQDRNPALHAEKYEKPLFQELSLSSDVRAVIIVLDGSPDDVTKVLMSILNNDLMM